MSREYITGTDFVTVQGIERRVDVTLDWQVWADQEKRLDNLNSLSAVMVAGYVTNLDNILDTSTIYKNSFDEYHRLVNSGAEIIEELEQDIESRLGTVFSQSYLKIYSPTKSILNKNILPIKVLDPRYMHLLTSNMSDSERIVNNIRNSRISENDKLNSIFQNKILANLMSRRLINADLITQELAVDQPKQSIESEATTGVSKKELQPGFTDVNEYSDAMVNYIKGIGSEPFGIEALILWANDQGYNPNPGEVERIVLLSASREGIVKKTNVYITNKTAREMWVLLKK